MSIGDGNPPQVRWSGSSLAKPMELNSTEVVQQVFAALCQRAHAQHLALPEGTSWLIDHGDDDGHRFYPDGFMCYREAVVLPTPGPYVQRAAYALGKHEGGYAGAQYPWSLALVTGVPDTKDPAELIEMIRPELLKGSNFVNTVLLSIERDGRAVYLKFPQTLIGQAARGATERDFIRFQKATRDEHERVTQATYALKMVEALAERFHRFPLIVTNCVENPA